MRGRSVRTAPIRCLVSQAIQRCDTLARTSGIEPGSRRRCRSINPGDNRSSSAASPRERVHRSGSAALELGAPPEPIHHITEEDAVPDDRVSERQARLELGMIVDRCQQAGEICTGHIRPRVRLGMATTPKQRDRGGEGRDGGPIGFSTAERCPPKVRYSFVTESLSKRRIESQENTSSSGSGVARVRHARASRLPCVIQNSVRSGSWWRRVGGVRRAYEQERRTRTVRKVRARQEAQIRESLRRWTGGQWLAVRTIGRHGSPLRSCAMSRCSCWLNAMIGVRGIRGAHRLTSPARAVCDEGPAQASVRARPGTNPHRPESRGPSGSLTILRTESCRERPEAPGQTRPLGTVCQ